MLSFTTLLVLVRVLLHGVEGADSMHPSRMHHAKPVRSNYAVLSAQEGSRPGRWYVDIYFGY